MRLSISDINKIGKADIKINGLTVIAGTNDSGKSTVGKMLFSIIKALTNSKDSSKSIDDTINTKVKALYRNLISFDQLYHTSIKRNIFGRTPPTNIAKLIKSQSEEVSDVMGRILVAMEEAEIKPLHKAVVNNLISEILDLMKESGTHEGMLKRELQAILKAEFMNSVCTYDTEQSTIVFSDESGSKELSVYLSDNNITEIKGGDGCFFDDITLIESPLYLHIIDVLSSARTFNEDERDVFSSLRPLVNYHIKDFAKKLESFKYSIVNSQTYNDDLQNINNITGGSFSFDQDSKNILWIKDNKKFQVVNVASGIKSFGVMQMLKGIDSINERKILIWDEPENHLHPEWQIKLAALLVEQASKGIPILVTSHSPYFIQAIRYFSNKMKMEKFVNYYMADEQENGTCIMNDYTEDLNKIFFKLAQPMNSIINIGL